MTSSVCSTTSSLISMAVLARSRRARSTRTGRCLLMTTFGTRAVARDMPVDVVQAILGHASLQTTSTYVRPEQQRTLEAAAQYYAAEDD
ncbi:tyrosine-type recombinase/integrase [Paraburkholderia sp. 5N]|uniref:Tyrosine-type recombinase/integrase n=2 Tax=Paraburkholderia elongata TaxID=2675747 RepID=A0A972SJZ3_9BURK|nr:tyrosine-type recombinase/integrase [Paraburkholderia elongata]